MLGLLLLGHGVVLGGLALLRERLLLWVCHDLHVIRLFRLWMEMLHEWLHWLHGHISLRVLALLHRLLFIVEGKWVLLYQLLARHVEALEE